MSGGIMLLGLPKGASDQFTLGLRDVMPFGKFKGKMIKDVITDNPYYLQELLSKNDKFVVDGAVTYNLESELGDSDTADYEPLFPWEKE